MRVASMVLVFSIFRNTICSSGMSINFVPIRKLRKRVSDNAFNKEGTTPAVTNATTEVEAVPKVFENSPNTALLSAILMFGTFGIGYYLRIFRNSHYFGRTVSGLCKNTQGCLKNLFSKSWSKIKTVRCPVTVLHSLSRSDH